ncbi:hypothetical protein E2C01_055551 [Portunus trituberculatus]|uniref:Uncharacterized protein n=1 Tax=Portunus trituberculatus TaxID=210409 RepID=A0A5B7GVB4_PORTR|nr:hypothetical protein [Portunus trituberculatus]
MITFFPEWHTSSPSITHHHTTSHSITHHHPASHHHTTPLNIT